MKLCECGCGEPAPISPRTHTQFGWVKGRPKRYVRGHNRRGKVQPPLSSEARAKLAESKRGARNPLWKGEGVSYKGLHAWLRREFPCVGVCEECGAEAPTEYANVSGEYRRDRSDFRELCLPCHRTLDHAKNRSEICAVS